MKLGVPWSVKGIQPAARQTAKEAARRAGVPLSDWLNTAILNSAADEGIDPAEFEVGEGSSQEIASVHARLDDLTRKIDRLVSTPRGPEAYAPPHVRAAPAMPPFIPPAPQMPPVRSGPFDQAAAEIAARQRALNGQPPLAAAPPIAPAAPAMMHAAPALAAAPAPVYAPPPAQDLSGLEEQLNRITDQIETLRRPGVEEAINALRGELAEIGHALNEAMPRQALDAIERQVQGLTQRLAEGREAGADGQSIANIEQGLQQIYDALHHLQPAESLVGFNEAIHALTERMDVIVAQKDPATLQQLESAITTLRGVSAHIASNETVRQLAEDVALLAEKVDRIANASGAGEALVHLEQRISALSDALAARGQNGDHVPPGLEALVHSLSSKIEQLQMSKGDTFAASHLEDRIVKLVERLDKSDNRLVHLEAIERGLADVLLHIEDMRAQKGQGGVRSDADAFKSDLARTQNTLDQLTGTLSHVVDRLAAIEHGVLGRANEEPLELQMPMVMPGKVNARAISEATAPQAAIPAAPPPRPAPPPPPAPAPPPVMKAPPAPEPQKRPPLPAKARTPINPDLPPDLPLEPGSGHPSRGDLAARIAASQAALGGAAPVGEEPPAGKSGFIAAARRAAKAALSQPAKPVQAATPNAQLWSDAETAVERKPALHSRLSKRIKSLFMAASVIAIVVGGVQISADQLGLWPKTASREGIDADTQVARDTAIERKAPALAERKTVTPTVSSVDLATTAPSVTTPPQLPTTALSSVPSLTGGAATNPDITGSITKRPAAAPAPAANDSRLPIAIGSVTLRNAASSGNSAAAYEVAVRYAEGRGIPANAEEAARWFERAARDGLAPAQFRLGSLYEKGNGVRKDLKEARRLYSAAAAKGNAKAMHNLAVLYAEGVEGKPDYAAAASWFQKAAVRGVPDSQYNLGILYARGLGIEKNLPESYKWFALAAVQGDKESSKKRDEIAARLDAKALASAQAAVKSWVAEQQPDDAITVPSPEGGWDRATGENLPPATSKPKHPGTFEVGKR
ncbi:MAG: SEL1-like repeat protein [Pseudolabrys sp.]|nr:SEL1-like repeat protein [Pseudolabrys sp.]